MKTSIFIIILIIFSINIKSQVISGYGLKLGAAISNQSWNYQTDINLDLDNKIGFSPRIFADFLNFPFIELEGEIGYSQKGFKDKVLIRTTSQPLGTGNYITENNKLNYLIFAALAKLKIESGNLTPYIIIGPQLNILMSKNLEKGWEVIFDKFKNNNFGLSLGAGTEIKNIFPISILVEYRFERDLIDNYDSPNIDIKNYSHVILLGIKI